MMATQSSNPKDHESEVSMEGMIKIENLTGRHLQYRIDHQKVCVKIGRCLCRQGRRSVEAMNVHVPGSGMSAPLPPAVVLCPEIKRDADGNRPKIKIHGAEKKEQAEAKAPEDPGSGKGTGAGTKDGDTGGSKSETGRKGQTKKSKETT